MSQQNQLLDFIARLCLVVLFPFSALNKIFDHQSAMAQAADQKSVLDAIKETHV